MKVKKIEVLTRGETKKLLDYLQSNFTFRGLGIHITLSTGMRIGEVCALQWEDIDVEYGLIRVGKTIQRIYTHDVDKWKTELIMDTPKTASSIREIPMSPALLKLMKPLKKIVNDDFFVLTNEPKPTEPRTYRSWYKDLMISLDLPLLKFHGLRHTFATRGVETGCDIKTISVLLGHSNISTTLNLYTHPNMEQKKKAIDQMFKKNVSVMGGYNSKWSAAEITQLEILYKSYSITEISGVLGRTYNAVKSKVLNLGLRKEKAELSKVLKRRTSASQFKKGQSPHNTLQDGAITIRGDGTGKSSKRKIYYIRLSEGKWYPLHHYIWENVFGPIPLKTCVGFKDGNSLNCLIDNLYLLKMSDNVMKNSHSIPLKDSFVAQTIVGSRNLKKNPELYEAVRQNKPLLEVKRAQLMLNREIKKSNEKL
ncbi:tyrosine-type recombinase/integrase [Oscillatoria amoena NRMC-F 0135]|nr:tyrosine-type recombinase/integrase [Oscillatoria amoena NRMC-F 0135]